MKKFNQNKKINIIIFSILCYCISIVTVYFSIKEQIGHFDLLKFFSSLFMVVILIATGTYQIIILKKEKYIIASEQKFIDNQKRNAKLANRRLKQQVIVKRNQSMFQEFYWYIVETSFLAILIVLIPCTILCFAIWKYYIDVPIWWLLVLWGLLFILFTIYCIYLLFAGPVKKLKEIILLSGYNIQAVNSDYMNGKRYTVMSGILNVGVQYTVYAGNNNFAFVIANDQIVLVEKIHENIEIMNPNYGKDKEDRYSIRINTNKYQKNVISNDIEADLILEEFERLGILTRKIKKIY